MSNPRPPPPQEGVSLNKLFLTGNTSALGGFPGSGAEDSMTS
jgi:hypothetical protein